MSELRMIPERTLARVGTGGLDNPLIDPAKFPIQNYAPWHRSMPVARIGETTQLPIDNASSPYVSPRSKTVRATSLAESNRSPAGR